MGQAAIPRNDSPNGRVEAAAATVDLTEIWDGEVVLSDIPVR